MTERKFYPEGRFAWVSGRLTTLPIWAQKVFSDMRSREITQDFDGCLNADVRRVAKQVLGQNLTFSDDDLRLLATLAVTAIDADLHKALPDPKLVENIDRAKAARHARALDEAKYSEA
jgi:hypothetical protein